MPERIPILDALIREVEAKATERRDTVAILVAVMNRMVSANRGNAQGAGARARGTGTTHRYGTGRGYRLYGGPLG
jgi:hypothetical protein